jgi:hypothetical protein
MDITALDDMRAAWQEQRPAGLAAWERPDAWEDLLTGLRGYEHRVLGINTVKMIAGAILLLFTMGVLLPKYASSRLVIGGASWIAVSFTVFAVMYWRRQFRARSLAFERSTFDLIQSARQGLERERSFFRRFMPLLGLILISGLQIVYLDLLRDDPWPTRLLLHGVSVVALAAALAGGLRFRERRFKREMQPLLDQLDSLALSLQEDEQ